MKNNCRINNKNYFWPFLLCLLAAVTCTIHIKISGIYFSWDSRVLIQYVWHIHSSLHQPWQSTLHDLSQGCLQVLRERPTIHSMWMNTSLSAEDVHVFFLGQRFGPQMLQTAYFLSKQLPFINCLCLFWKKETKEKVKIRQVWECVLLEQICFVWNLWHCFQ